LTQLSPGDEAQDVQVLWEDQQRINTFSKLNARLSGLEDDYELKKSEKEYLEDATQEIELIDEDEQVPYKVGDSFFWVKQSELSDRLEKEIELADEGLSSIEEQMANVTDEMNDLKAMLYAKFGKSINLER
ncbi:Prefoldin beta-like protein, partial [Dipodascopsis tothii]|uniref:Prefoldin beta-like protein n=1 Tax=Dipodascopsis tothii TaxID=44089 RepID=UPI0034CF6A82